MTVINILTQAEKFYYYGIKVQDCFDKNLHFTCPRKKSIVLLNFEREEDKMWYWIVMFVLIAGCAVMLAVSFNSIKKTKALAAETGGKRRRSRRDEYDEDDEYDEPPRRRRRQEAEEVPASRPKKKKRRQWKIILEDIDSWDKYTFTFYDTVGIGRGKDGSMYEKYLPVMGDGRISKVHCVIIHRGDKLYLQDEGSRNGTFLNGELIDRPAAIQRDDIIGIGETRLEVQRILRESDE